MYFFTKAFLVLNYIRCIFVKRNIKKKLDLKVKRNLSINA